MLPPYTNLYDQTTPCYWLDFKLFKQSECRSINQTIIDCRGFISTKEILHRIELKGIRIP